MNLESQEVGNQPEQSSGLAFICEPRPQTHHSILANLPILQRPHQGSFLPPPTCELFELVTFLRSIFQPPLEEYGRHFAREPWPQSLASRITITQLMNFVTATVQSYRSGLNCGAVAFASHG